MVMIPANAQVDAFHHDLNELLRKHAGHLRAEELLAVSAQVVGQIIAFQDRRVFSQNQVMQIVQRNLVLGNQAACETVASSMGPIQ